MAVEEWRKVLSRTDAGESQTHQSGILISVVDGERMFPNGSGFYRCQDKQGVRWEIHFTHRAKKSESRITWLKDWMRRFDVRSGDSVLLSALADGSYFIEHLPKDTSPKEEAEDLSGFPEGGKKRIEVNWYERDKRNRKKAIELHGVACLACNTRMADRYGEIADGFIHIHHVKSLSATGQSTPDVEKDLIPLCPNCHSIVHLANPPLTLEELKRKIEQAQS